jgi:cation diffusion facilitator CzcD-associated flavoprotein CzcO
MGNAGGNLAKDGVDKNALSGEDRQLVDFAIMDDIRARVSQIVKDPATAEALKPWYDLWCKRPCFHDEYLQAFNEPTVKLLDTDGQGVDAITERGVVVGGVEYPVDCIAFATGFEVGTGYAKRLGFEVKYSDAPTTTKSMHVSLATLNLDRLFIVYPGSGGSFPIDEKIEAIAIQDLGEKLAEIKNVEREE